MIGRMPNSFKDEHSELGIAGHGGMVYPLLFGLGGWPRYLFPLSG